MGLKEGLVNRKRVVAAVFLLLLIILVLVLLWWWFWRGTGETPSDEPTTPVVEDRVILPPTKQTVNGPTVEPAAQPTAGELYIMNLARDFAERYGSFSTDRSFQNLIDVYPLITASLRAQFEATVAAGTGASAGASGGARPGAFKGVETRALSVDIANITASRADVTVVTQRNETDQDLRTNTTYQTLDLTILKSGEFWYVDEAAWLDE